MRESSLLDTKFRKWVIGPAQGQPGFGGSSPIPEDGKFIPKQLPTKLIDNVGVASGLFQYTLTGSEMDPGSYDLKLPQPCIRTPKRFLLSFFGAGLNLSPPPGFGYSISTASDIVRTIAITKNVESCKACDFAGVGSILEIAFAIGVSSEGDKVVPTDDILARTVKTTSPVITAGQVLHEAVLPLLRAIFGQSYRSVGGLGVQLLLFGESSETELIYTPNSLNRLIPALSKGIIKGDISFLADMLPMCAVCCCTISGFTVGIALYKGFWNVQPLSRERPMERPILRTFSSSA